MENILYYPTLTQEMLEAAGISAGSYTFSYDYQGSEYKLDQKGSSTLKISDSLDIWKIESEGLKLKKEVRIAYPDLLYGEDGIICHGAELSLCIIWVNRELSQTGIILPEEEVRTTQGSLVYRFRHAFSGGTVSGNLELSVTAYVKTPATEVLPGEENLINEAGVTIGEIEDITLNFSSLYMDFPMEELRSKEEPLWWLEISDWEDPKTIDLFSKESFCLYVNPEYKACPSPSVSSSGGTIKNFDMMIDILSQTYFLLFQKLEETDDLKATINNEGLAPNTICSVLHQFIENCSNIEWNPPQNLLKSLQINLRKMLQDEEESA